LLTETLILVQQSNLIGWL